MLCHEISKSQKTQCAQIWQISVPEGSESEGYLFQKMSVCKGCQIAGRLQA